tara:strand:- start:3717 stop:4172 length:456 start_codon:yes stop_codon:yes gene_type:complete
MSNYNIYDNFLEPLLLDYCQSYFRYDTSFCFQTSEQEKEKGFFLMGLPPHDSLIDFIFYKIKTISQKNLHLLRFYTNLQFSNMTANTHIDDGQITCLLMLEGEGDFELGQEVIPFKENRLILFNSKIPHRGRSPTKGYRITLAFKTNEILN